MKQQKNASLFAPACRTFEAAQGWIATVQSGEVTSFVPIHGKVAGYHVEADDQNVPLQKLTPPVKPETEVRILKVNHIGNISIVPDKDDSTVAHYYPHINVDVAYEAVEEQPAS